ncbi:hypothetical protein CDN99_01760 [Roseateles aquatilis]|uniref:YXWGXW repeat-containing protein n=1 Tax=Roseateles aquatilis TaxID=431061 RepID=A0A246JL17_9BURK|nr:hypothetical protein [Roseateles aquatilis]OWQ93240.1 hypothetical protein CDN99_01760 [Roseateles aquatilis]
MRVIRPLLLTLAATALMASLTGCVVAPVQPYAYGPPVYDAGYAAGPPVVGYVWFNGFWGYDRGVRRWNGGHWGPRR